MPSETISICCCKSRSFIEKEKVARITSILRKAGKKVNLIDDLCALFTNDPDKVKEITQGTIMACHTRAVSSQLKALDLEPNQIINIRSQTAEETLHGYQLNLGDSSLADYNEIIKEIEDLPQAIGTDAWYPVIDKSRCTNCGKCNDFCLFGVYTVENNEVLVTNPQNCKNNCPACARMCPSLAIIFPKYEKSPINGGTEIEESFSEEDKQAMYQKRLQYRLQQNRNRFSLLKKDQ